MSYLHTPLKQLWRVVAELRRVSAEVRRVFDGALRLWLWSTPYRFVVRAQRPAGSVAQARRGLRAAGVRQRRR